MPLMTFKLPGGFPVTVSDTPAGGEVLTFNAATNAWDAEAAGGGGAPHALLDGVTDNDTLAAAPTLNALIQGNATPLWASRTSVLLSEIAVPATPAANSTNIYAYDNSGFSDMAFKNDNGVIEYVGNLDIWRRKRAIAIYPSPISTSSILSNGHIGGGNTTITGTWAAVAPDADGARRNLPTAATLNNESGFNSSSATNLTHNLNVDLTLKFKIISTTVLRFWFGFFVSTPMASDVPTIEHFGMRLSTSAGNVNYVLSTADGVTQSEVQIAVADAAVHTLRLISDSTNSRIGYSWDGAAVVWKTTNLPVGTTALQLWCRLRTLEAVAKNWDWWWIDGWIDK